MKGVVFVSLILGLAAPAQLLAESPPAPPTAPAPAAVLSPAPAQVAVPAQPAPPARPANAVAQRHQHQVPGLPSVRHGGVKAVAEVKGPVTLRLETVSGDVRVEAGGAGQVVVAVDEGDASVVRLLSRGADRIEAEFDGQQRLSRGQAHVWVPPGCSLDLRTVSGALLVTGIGGDARVLTTSGDVQMSGLGRADVRTISGAVALKDVRGEVRVRTVSGDVSIVAAGVAAVAAAPGAAGAPVAMWSGPRLEYESTSGDLEWTGLCGKGCHLEARAATGDVRLSLQDKSSFELRFASHSGDLSDELKLAGLQRGEAPLGGTLVSGRQGEGEGLIECSTFSGDLQLRRR